MDSGDAARVTAEIVRRLYDTQANEWSIADKGVLMAAIKQQLKEPPSAPRLTDGEDL